MLLDFQKKKISLPDIDTYSLDTYILLWYQNLHCGRKSVQNQLYDAKENIKVSVLGHTVCFGKHATKL
jgi:hypothetical protein